MAGSMLRLRAGCRQFATSAGKVCLMLPSNKMYRLEEKKVVNISSEKEFESNTTSVSASVVGSSHGWVGLMEEEDDRVRCGSLSLWNPMSGSRTKLPPIPQQYSGVERLVVDDGECSRAVIVGSENWLGVCCPGRCSEWTLFGHDKQYEDVVACSASRVYSLDIHDEVVRWDISDPRRPREEWKKDLYEVGYDGDDDEKKNFPRMPVPLCAMFLHLAYAEHSGQLFLVTRHYVEGMDPHGAEVQDEDLWNSETYPDKTIAFDVHLLGQDQDENENETKLRYMEHSLDGMIMFVGINNALAVPAADFPHLKPDSIYFTDQASHIPPKWADRIYGGHDVGIYDYKNRTISSCYYPSHHHSFKRICPHPFWLAPSLYSNNNGLDQ